MPSWALSAERSSTSTFPRELGSSDVGLKHCSSVNAFLNARTGEPPTSSSRQRILSPSEAILPNLTNETNQYLPDWQPSKSCFVRLGLTTECRHLSVIR